MILIIYSSLVLEDTFQPKKGGEGKIKETKTFFMKKGGEDLFQTIISKTRPRYSVKTIFRRKSKGG